MMENFKNQIDYLIDLATQEYLNRDLRYKRHAYIAWRMILHNNLRFRKYNSVICRKCGSLLVGSNAEIRVKNKFINIKCINCGYIKKIYVKSS